MMENLWSDNAPRNFWRCQPDPPDEVWAEATRKAIPVLGLSHQKSDIETVLQLTLGEAQFGADHWQLSRTKRLYYMVKPYLPRTAIDLLKNINSHLTEDTFSLGWPVEKRYAQFQWEAMRQLLIVTGQSSAKFRHFWPEGQRFVFVLTHDIETGEGQALVRDIADLEEELGFRSAFNFVPEGYPLDEALMDELRERGFEIGVHGLKHDGKLFSSQIRFMERAERINMYLRSFKATGFRSPLTHRHPEWMQALEIEYDLSFFDTDPYEPMPGGSMSIWPYRIGRFIELPYTLTQDCTLGFVLGESSPQIWLEKLDFIESYFGMALVITHPDYLRNDKIKKIYLDFMRTVKDRGGYWHALPHEVAQWWRVRAEAAPAESQKNFTVGTAIMEDDRVLIR